MICPFRERRRHSAYETARQHGFEIVHNLMEDSRTTHRWYFVVVMGRTAGHLALGVGKAAGATLSVIPEEFPGAVHLESRRSFGRRILKRQAFGSGMMASR